MNCAEFDFDDGDCESAGSGGSGSGGSGSGGSGSGGSGSGGTEVCSDPGDIEDCNGECYPGVWIGDSYCEDGSWGPDFNCSEFDWDGGDCDASSGGSGSGGSSSTDECVDIDDGATDLTGDACSDYDLYPSWCGDYDDDDFDSMAMCCACGGGSIGGGSSGGSGTGSSTGPGSDECSFDYYVAGVPAGTMVEFTSSWSPDWVVSCDRDGADAPDVAYKWTPSFTRDYVVAATGMGFDVVLAVFDEDCTTELSCSDTYADGGFAEAVTGLFYAGSSYYIVVKGYESSDAGMIEVDILPAP